MSKTVKVAIAGFGLAGRVFHAGLLKNLPKHFQIVEVVSSSPEKVKEVLPKVQVHARIEDVKDAECVVIATPSHTHYEIGKTAIALGKHVVIDKPISATVAEAEELIDAAQKKGVLLTVFQNRRWDNGFLTALDLRSRGVLGEVVQFNASFDRFRPEVNHVKWREQNLPASGVLYDLGTHLIDQAIQFFGLPDKWSIECACQREKGEQVDSFVATLKFGDKIAVLSSSSLAASPRPTIEVFGTLGSYVKRALDPQEEQLKNGIGPGDKEWGVELERERGIITLATNDFEQSPVPSLPGSYESFYQGVYRAIRDQAPVPVDPSSVLLPLMIIEEGLKRR